VFLRLIKIQGPAVARNFGVKQATGNIVFFIDSDAGVYSNTIGDIIKRFQKDSSLQGLTIAWSDEALVNNFFNKFKAIESNYLAKNVWSKAFGSNGSAIYKDIFVKEGGFDENFKTAHAEDFYFGMKLFGRGYNIELDNDILMQNSYLDNFFFAGLKKYSKRAFLRALVIYQIKNLQETSYNSKKFKILYLLSGLVFLFLLLSFVYPYSFYFALLSYLVFLWLNKKLYYLFYKKHGIFFAVKSIILHYIYILVVVISGTFGLLYARLFKKKNTL